MSRRVMETWLEVILHFAGRAARDVPLALDFPRAGKMFAEVLERCNYSRAAAGRGALPQPSPTPKPRISALLELLEPLGQRGPRWDGGTSRPCKGSPRHARARGSIP